jgi:hypothetical protein
MHVVITSLHRQSTHSIQMPIMVSATPQHSSFAPSPLTHDIKQSPTPHY